MSRFLWICLGGAAGTGARYLISVWLLRVAPGFPWGTLTVNVLGSFLIGLILQVARTTDLLSPTLALALTTGFLGGFTTYSAFNYETLQFFQRDEWLLGCANLGGTVAACLVAGVLGTLAGRLLAGS